MSIRHIASRASIAALLVITTWIASSHVAAGQGATAPTAVQSSSSSPSGLRFEKMLYLSGKSNKTVPAGYLWQVQSVLSTEASLTLGFGASFMDAFKNKSEAGAIASSVAREHALSIDGQFYYVSGFPLNLEAGTKVSAGTDGGVIVVMQLKIE